MLAAGVCTAVCAVSATSTLVSALFGTAAGAAAKAPVKIGVIMPLTGTYATIGQQIVAGLKVEVNALNTSGGVLGGKVVLDVKDDKSLPQTAALAAHAMQQDGVAAVMLTPIATEATAALPVLSSAKIVSITGSGDGTLTKISTYPMNFSYSIPFTAYGPPMVYAAHVQGAKRVGILTTDDTTGQAFGAVFKTAFQDTTYNVKLVSYQTYLPTATDVTSQLQKFVTTKVDTIVLQAPGALLGVVMNSVETLGLTNVQILADNGTVTTNLAKLVPVGLKKNFRAVVVDVLARSNPAKLDPQYSAYVSKLQKYLTPIPSLEAPLFSTNYLGITAWAINKAGSTSSSKIVSALQTVGKAKLPQTILLGGFNPSWTASNHSSTGADFSKSWSVVRAGVPLYGTYVGTPLNVPAS